MSFLTDFIAMNAADLAAFLPRQGDDWSMDSDQYFNNENLYIDGAAELYLSYGFNTAISRRYVWPR
ncbi:MAG: hypothetical protein AAGU19_07510 [Prolixibacteraceae bacterium]